MASDRTSRTARSPDAAHVAGAGISVTVDVTAGPRIVSARGATGEELLAQLIPPVRVGPATGPRTDLHGGHRLWVAPEVPEMTYTCDDGPATLAVFDGGAVAADAGRPLARRLEVEAVGSTVRLRHVVTNTGDQALRLAPWAITQLRPGGTAYLPVGRRSPDVHGLQASGAIITWPYTRLEDPRIGLRDGVVTIDAAGMTPDTGPVKVGTDGTEPWMAYVVGDDVIIIRPPSRPPPGAFADLGATLQSYACHRFVELETVGALTHLLPGEDRVLEQRWSVHRRTWHPDEPALPHLRQLSSGDPGDQFG